MRLLLCCQFYPPSVGGVQEVMRQIAERLVAKGHQVTVATSALPERRFATLSGVAIREFGASGNLVGGMRGDLEAYRDFVLNGPFDLMLVYAAQQWTFDALWPILERIPFPAVFIPCGFSALYEPGYAGYFAEMPAVLRQFDRLVFNASKYRDIDLARAHGITAYAIVPNGASEDEFLRPVDPDFRQRHGIPEQSFLFLTVGSFTGLKGHLEVVRAFERLVLPTGSHATLVLNGNEVRQTGAGARSVFGKFAGLVKTLGLRRACAQALKKALGSASAPRKIADRINATRTDRQVLVTDLPRAELTQAFFASDLFVFASNIEYSPLVLFEAAAAGTPFLTVDVGNALEIAEWTGAGDACPSRIDDRGYTRVDVDQLAARMGELMRDPERLRMMGAAGRSAWLRRFTWDKITAQYEQIFLDLLGRH